MKKSILALTLTLSISSIAHADFIYHEGKDRLTGDDNSIVLAESFEGQGSIAIGCNKYGAALFATPDEFVSGANTKVAYKFGSGEVNQAQWTVTSNKHATLIGEQAVEFVSEASKHSELIIRVHTHRSYETGVYSTRGLADGAAKLWCYNE